MKQNIEFIAKIIALLFLLCHSQFGISSASQRPNIILILADDLGMGDISAYNPRQTLITPNIDRIAKNGMRFTDAHTNSSVCTPTRYGLLTGQYAWRTHLKKGALHGFSSPLIKKNEMTIASMLEQAGYHTGMVGKWHLGLDWDKNWLAYLTKNRFGINYEKGVGNGPVDKGFDYYYGIPASLDMPPYVFIQDKEIVTIPSSSDYFSDKNLSWSSRARSGRKSKDFRFDQVGTELMHKAEAFIKNEAFKQPFFLYYALPSPHKPFAVSRNFKGKSGLGYYGDYVLETDYWIGRILETLEASNILENTLIIFTSDNGTPMKMLESGKEDHSHTEHSKGYLPSNHLPSLHFRGYKSDIWEGGHRVPFIVSWKGHVPADTINSNPILITDLLPTIAAILNIEPNKELSIDGQDISTTFYKPQQALNHQPIILHSINGSFAIRHGDWKLIMTSGSGGWSERSEPWRKPYQLYNLKDDPYEEHNIINERKEKALELYQETRRIIGKDSKIPKQY